jgi:hypothetical protein
MTNEDDENRASMWPVCEPPRLGSGIDYGTSIRMQHLAGHVGSVFRRKENEAGRYLIGLPHAPHRHLRTVLSRLVLVKRGWDERGPDWAGRDRVDPSSFRREPGTASA